MFDMTLRRLPTLLLAAAATAISLAAQSVNPPLTLAEARALALKNHPQVLASQALTSRADQLTREARSAYYPTVNGDITGSQAEVNARIGAGILTDSRLFNHAGAGLTLTQLITDSGRTHNLVADSSLQAQASRQDYQASRYDVISAVDQAYYEVLLSKQLVNVSEQTVKSRQTVVDQISELTRNKLKSDVDLSFAQVNLADANLMLLRARDRLQSSYAVLAQTLGTQQNVQYELKDEPMPPQPPADEGALVKEAFGNRPEVASLHLQTEAAQKFVFAERDLKRPNVTLTGVGGALPYINPGNANADIPKTYEGIALNVQIPIFNGFLFSARRQAAQYQMIATQQHERDLQDRIARDVRTAYERVKTSFEAIAATRQLLTQANLSLNLAQGRYDLGLASIVELTQAQLGQTSAQVQNLDAKYEYQEAYAALQYTLGLLH
ncbi:MAG TPA: TolC family protein [Bryobacteraceae bacterium]|jgi:outer membrane protein|nr:TolC family protein [Bryobacteraceae bacterium]